MSNNFKKIAVGLLALVVFGACSSEPKEEVGRYVPINTGGSFIDTKTGRIYFPNSYVSPERGYYCIDAVKAATQKKWGK